MTVRINKFETYKERLETFSDWPEDLKPIFIKKLAIIGQYSTDVKELATSCVYCNENLLDWKPNDNVLLEHFKRNSTCPIFRLHFVKNRIIYSISNNNENVVNYKNFRKSLKTDEFIKDAFGKENRDILRKDIVKKNIKDTFFEQYIERKFLKLKISKEITYYACMICGSPNLEHICKEKLTRITVSNINTKNNALQFYLKYLNGSFIDQIDQILDSNRNKILNTNLTADWVSYLLKKLEFTTFESFDSFLSRGSEYLYAEIEEELKIKEGEAIAKISEDPIIIN